MGDSLMLKPSSAGVNSLCDLRKCILLIYNISVCRQSVGVAVV